MSIFRKTLVISSIFFMAIIVGGSVSFAQNFTSRPSLVVSPAYPGPFEDITVKAESNIYSLSSARIVWRVNGREVSGGIGATSLKVKTGDVGERLTVDMMAETAEGRVVSSQTVIVPAEVDLIWEAETYVPPFYRGKALLSDNSMARIVALPNIINADGARLNASELLYTWKLNGTVHENQSGFGKQVARFPVSLRTPTVQVDVKDRTGRVYASEQILLQTFDPLVRLYRSTPGRGVVTSQSLTGRRELSGQEISLVMYPYYFSVDGSVSTDLEYIWFIDDRETQTVSPAQLTLRRESSGGRATVKAGILSNKNSFQRAVEEVTISLTSNE